MTPTMPILPTGQPMSPTVEGRIFKSILWPPSLTACWLWNRALDRDGYGRFRLQNRSLAAHRVTYTMFRGEIPVDLTIDHLCRVRRCVNPLHLEAVSMRLNLVRAESFVVSNSLKTHCDHGHPFDSANTYMWRGNRTCRACKRRHVAEYKARRRQREAVVA